MLKEFRQRYDKPEDFLVSIIDGLIADGLIQREKGILRLPRQP